MPVKPKIFYIKPNNSSFISGDQEIFEKKYQVRTLLMEQSKGNVTYAVRMVHMLFFLFSSLIYRKAIFVSWFADYHSAVMVFMGKVLGKDTVVFVGGQEAVSYPELGKGVYRKPIRGMFVKYALKNASLIIANHKSLFYHENYYYKPDSPKIDGIKHYVKNFKTPTEVVFNGIDSGKFVRNESIAKLPNRVLTVGTMSHEGDFYNKGFDLFIKTAQITPELDFVLVGLNPAYLNWVEENYQVAAIANLRIIPSFCPQDVLNEMYNQATVFVQASITEGMPNTLSEAMLLECIPVGSNVNGIPDAIGDTGVVIKQRDENVLRDALIQAKSMNTGKVARQRVLSLFSFEKREKEILEIFKLRF